MKRFRKWLTKPVGRRLLELESIRINEIIPTLFGYNAILVGEPNFGICMEQSPIKSWVLINEDSDLKPDHCQLALISARHDRLPLESASVDVIYLAHTLEFACNPHEVLREAYRVLRPDGHLIVTVFYPLSAWGLWRLIARLGVKVPWRAKFMAAVQLKDWLALLGFDIMRINYFGFNLPLKPCEIGAALSRCERYSQKLCLPFGAAYLIEASKRIIPLTPVMPSWKLKPDLLIDDVTEPTV